MHGTSSLPHFPFIQFCMSLTNIFALIQVRIIRLGGIIASFYSMSRVKMEYECEVQLLT